MKKKVLIVTYYWPPAGGPGVQRWLKFVKYLPDFGIEPVVYVPENPHYPIIDEKLLAEVPAGVEIIRQNITEPYGLFGILSKKKAKTMSSGVLKKPGDQSLLEKFALWVRGNLFIPDARKFWVGPSIKKLKDYLEKNPVDAVITTGPPHSLHLIGLGLKRQTGVRWIADFRDPWTTIGYQKDLRLTARSAEKHRKMEKEVLQSADQIIVTSPTTQSDFRKITSVPVHLITNGYDNEIVERKPVDKKFSIAHIGSLLSQRNPKLLWEVLGEMLIEIDGFSSDLELKFMGVVSEEVLATLAGSGLKPYLRMMGYVPHDQAVAEQRCSQVLLLIEIDSPETRSIIPGKLFEYMVSQRPIVAIGPSGSDFAEIIRSTNTGVFVNYQQRDLLKQTLQDLYGRYKNETLDVAPIGLQQYSRKNLAGRLAELI